MQIRRACPADYLAITALDRVAWDTLERPDTLADGEHTWRIWVEHALVWVAEEAGEIIGVLLAFPTLGMSSPRRRGSQTVSPEQDSRLRGNDSKREVRAQEREPLVGATVSSIAQHSSAGRGETQKPTLCLHKVFVAKAGRGKGVGSALFDSFLKYSDEHSLSSFLTVAPFNESAIALYEKMGFVKAEYVEGYYRPDEHRWVMIYGN